MQDRIEAEIPLITKRAHAIKPTRKWAHPASTTAQVTLGIIGLGAGALYFGPAATCSETPTCGKWLVDYTTKDVAIVAFSAGGLDYAGINAFFSAKSIQTFVDYIKKQNTRGAKIGKGMFVIVYALTQNIPIVFASLGTSTASWQSFLTVSGAIPGALYGAVGMSEHELPYILSKAKQWMTKMHHCFVDLCMPITEIERHHRNRLAHYAKEHAIFLKQVEAKWQYIISKANVLRTEGQDDPLDFLFQQRESVQSRSRIRNLIHRIGQVTGVAVAANMMAPFLANTFDFVKSHVPTTPLQLISTLLLSSSGIYGNIKLTVHGITSLFDVLIDTLRGKPTHSSLLFKLRPGTTSVVLMLSLAASALSYAVANTLFEKEFPNDDNALRNSLRYGAVASMDIYHFAGLWHLYHLLFSRLTCNQKEKFIFLIEHEVERLKKMTQDEFIAFVEHNDVIKNELYGVHPYALQEGIEGEEEEQDALGLSYSPSTQHVPINAPPQKQEEKKPSCLSSWCGWFTRKKDRKEQPVFNQPALEFGP